MGIKKKFMVLIALIGIILIIVSGIGYYNSQKQLTSSIEDSLGRIVDNQADQVDNWMMTKAAKMIVIADTMGSMPENIIASKGIVNGTAHDKDIQNFYNARENGMFIRADDRDALPVGFNPTTRDWYKNAKAKNGLNFTDVYLDIGTNKNVVSAAFPYKDQAGKIQGVLGMDISLDIMNEIAQKIKISDEGKGFIIDKSGVVIAQGDGGVQETSVQESALFKEHWQEIQNNDHGTFAVNVNGEKMLFSYAKAHNLGWTVGIIVAESFVYSDLVTMKINYSVITLLSVAILLFLGLRFSSMITKPILMLTESAGRMASGDLQGKDLEVTTSDEIGTLVKAFNTMSDNLRKLIHQVSDSSEQIAASSEELTAGAHQSAEAANHVAGTIVNVAEGMQDQMITLETTAQEVAGVADEIAEVAKQTDKVSDISNKTANEAQQGEKLMVGAIEQMAQIEKTVIESAAVVSRLGENSKEIGQIVDTISGIAGQTNLLALNAAIEAARAGEQGRGFAVVAEEVRKLAEQSQNATQEITKLITNIQADTTQAVEAMDSGSKEVKEGSESIKEVGSAFKAILGMVQEITGNMAEVAKSVQQVSAGSEKIVGAIEKVNKVSQEATDQTQSISAATEEQSASTEEIASSSRALAQMAEDMQTMINKFKV